MISDINPFSAVRVNRVYLSAQVHEAVKRAIVEGSLAPGQELSEVSLARQLNVSRTPLREAVKTLQAQGFLRRDGERLLVPELSRHELEDLYMIRAELEGLAARQAAQRATAAGVRELNACHARIRDEYDRPDKVDQLVLAGTAFHHKIAELSGNPTNLAFIRNILDHIARYRSVGALEGREMYLEDHAGIVDAVARGDDAGAEGAVREHLRHALLHVLERLPEGLSDTAPARAPAGGLFGRDERS